MFFPVELRTPVSGFTTADLTVWCGMDGSLPGSSELIKIVLLLLLGSICGEVLPDLSGDLSSELATSDIVMNLDRIPAGGVCLLVGILGANDGNSQVLH